MARPRLCACWSRSCWRRGDAPARSATSGRVDHRRGHRVPALRRAVSRSVELPVALVAVRSPCGGCAAEPRSRSPGLARLDARVRRRRRRRVWATPVAIANVDDEYVAELFAATISGHPRGRAPRPRQPTASSASRRRARRPGIRRRRGTGRASTDVHPAGPHNVTNALCAAALARSQGVPPEAVAAGSSRLLGRIRIGTSL